MKSNMFKCNAILLLIILYMSTFVDGKRRNAASSQHHLGDFCIPGTCTSLNSNCKRVGGSAFRCVCKEQYMSVNKTHCVRVINASMDSSCSSCISRGGVCLDEDTDDRMDRCFCQTESDLCHGRTTTTAAPVTQSSPKIIPVATAASPSQTIKQGDLQLGLYDINQQRLINNGGSVFIGDRLFLEIKYQSAESTSVQHQIITENCSISSSVSDNDSKLEKFSLLTNRCPSIDSRYSIHFQRLDPDHVKSSIFQIQKFETTSVVYVRCSVAICYGRIENCQERLCPEIRRASAAHRPHSSVVNATSPTAVADSGPFDYVDEDGASVIALRRRRKRSRMMNIDEHQTKKKLARLISDLTSSIDQRQADKDLDPVDHYEIRQVQQQFTIEVPITQSTPKHKTAYDAIYGRTSLASQGAVERSTVIAAISIIFMIGISVSLFVVYRTCYIEYAQRIYGSTSFAGFGGPGESVYGGARSTSQVCRYDMGRRSEQRFDESFFVSNVEPLGAYRRQY